VHRAGCPDSQSEPQPVKWGTSAFLSSCVCSGVFSRPIRTRSKPPGFILPINPRCEDDLELRLPWPRTGWAMSRKDRVEAMLKLACELASQGHRPQMIEAMLAANGFPEAVEFIEQHHIKKGLVELADQARRSSREGKSGDEPTDAA
jgi:hypothetical protein